MNVVLITIVYSKRNQKVEMTKIKLSVYGVFSVLLMAALMLGTVPAQAQTQPPDATPTPEGLSADDWAQIQAALPSYPQRAYVKASNTQEGDIFGAAVAVSGDTVVITAIGEDSRAHGVNGDQNDDQNWTINSGAAYVFVRNGDTWSQQAYLKASNPWYLDSFGSSVAISGDTIVIGAPAEDSKATGVNGNQWDNSLTNAGAAYVFVRNGTTWSQQAYLKASNPDEYDSFGGTVAISGDTIAIGATGEDSNARGLNGNQQDDSWDNTGAVYIFGRNGTTWSQQVYMKASDMHIGDAFGSALAMSGNTLVVGTENAIVTLPSGNARCGAAYIFVQTGGVWNEQTKLLQKTLPGGCGKGDRFGGSVAISGDTIAVGAAGDDSSAQGVNGDQDDNSAPDSGGVSVFVRHGTTWSEQAYLKASNTETKDAFHKVAISGNTIVVGAPGEDSHATGLNGDQADNSLGDAGAVYIFGRSGTTWSQQAYLKASNTDATDNFGLAVAFSGRTIAVSAPLEYGGTTGINGDQTDNSAWRAGTAYFVDAFPTVLSGQRLDTNPTTAASVDYKVTFSESVTGVDVSDFTLAVSNGISNASISGVSGGPKTYTVSVNTGSGSGTLRLNVLDDDSIVNANNIPLGDAGVGNGNFYMSATYLIRPLTQTFQSQAAQDGWVLESAEDSEMGSSMNNTAAVFNLGDDVTNRQYRAILHFKTGSLPDTAVITKATLRIKKYSLMGADPFTVLGNLCVDISNPYFGTELALQLTDFEAAPSTPAIAGLFDKSPVGSLYSAVLNNTGRTNLNRTGTTQFRLRFSTGDNDNLTADFIKFYSGNAQAAANQPALVVEYYIP